MSWQTYVDEHLICDMDAQRLSSAAIIGHDGSVWAQSSNFPQFNKDEIAAIVKDFDEPGSVIRGKKVLHAVFSFVLDLISTLSLLGCF